MQNEANSAQIINPENIPIDIIAQWSVTSISCMN